MDMSKVWNLMHDEIPLYEGVYSPMKVLHSNAGFYIGRTFRERGDDFDMPGSRESAYFVSEEKANFALQNGFEWRDCGENVALYQTYYQLLEAKIEDENG